MFDSLGNGTITYREIKHLLKSLGLSELTFQFLELAKTPKILDVHRKTLQNKQSAAAGAGPSSVNTTKDTGATLGLSYPAFMAILNDSAIQAKLHFGVNAHDAHFNTKCFQRAISAVSSGAVSLDDVLTARLSFNLYQGEIEDGLPGQAKYIRSALKMAGRVIAPKRLEAWLRSLKPIIPNRVQLFEFFEVLAQCAEHDAVFNPELDGPPASNSTLEKVTGLYKMTEQRDLITEDERLERRLDQEYEARLAEERALRARNKQKEESQSQAGAEEPLLTLGGSLALYRDIRASVRESGRNVVASRGKRAPSEGRLLADLASDIFERAAPVSRAWTPLRGPVDFKRAWSSENFKGPAPFTSRAKDGRASRASTAALLRRHLRSAPSGQYPSPPPSAPAGLGSAPGTPIPGLRRSSHAASQLSLAAGGAASAGAAPKEAAGPGRLPSRAPSRPHSRAAPSPSPSPDPRPGAWASRPESRLSASHS
eukprot:tig00021608_g22841.t1